MTKANPQTTERYVDLFKTPWNPCLCLGCGGDPCDVWDALGHYRTGRDETRTLNARGLCPDCQRERDAWEARA